MDNYSGLFKSVIARSCSFGFFVFCLVPIIGSLPVFYEFMRLLLISLHALVFSGWFILPVLVFGRGFLFPALFIFCSHYRSQPQVVILPRDICRCLFPALWHLPMFDSGPSMSAEVYFRPVCLPRFISGPLIFAEVCFRPYVFRRCVLTAWRFPSGDARPVSRRLCSSL